MTTAATPDQPYGSIPTVPDLPDDFAETFVEQTHDVGGVYLHTVTGGDGPPVLLVGGWPQFWWQWRKVMPQLAQEFTVTAVDPRGFGLSDRPRTGYDTAQLAADVHGLAERLGYDRFHLVGHDVGMWIAYAMAADAPSPIDKLALLDATLPGISPAHSAIPDTTTQAESQWHFMFNRLDEVNAQLVQGREEIFFGRHFAVKGAHPTAMPEATVEVYLAMLRRPGALQACFEPYRALDATIAQNRRRAQHLITMPVLAGGGSTALGPTIGAAVRQIASNVIEFIVPECGHYLAEEAPHPLAEQLQRFLTST